jgi:hypothetical protein
LPSFSDQRSSSITQVLTTFSPSCQPNPADFLAETHLLLDLPSRPLPLAALSSKNPSIQRYEPRSGQTSRKFA